MSRIDLDLASLRSRYEIMSLAAFKGLWYENAVCTVPWNMEEVMLEALKRPLPH